MSGYIPPKIWIKTPENAEHLSGLNQPTAGSRFYESLPMGNHPIQLYSLGTPNGQKVTIMLEELLQQGISEAEYDAYMINIGNGDQFGSGFVNINPNSKIPAMIDNGSSTKLRVFESGNILLYLAEKFRAFLPSDVGGRVEVMNWLFWLQGSAPYLGGGFGHFYVYAKEKQEYPIERFTIEVKRQLDVLDKQLASNTYIAGQEYTIADIAIWPWYGNLILGNLYNAAEYLSADSYPNLIRWAKMIANRTAVIRGRIVNRAIGDEWECLKERHSAADIDMVLAKKLKS